MSTVEDVGRRRQARPGLCSGFADANKRFCKHHLQPQLYPVSHMTALDTWFERRTMRVPENGALLEFGCGRTFRLAGPLGGRFVLCDGTDLEDVQPHEVPADVVFRQCTAEVVPFGNAQFDVVVIRSVMEYIDGPAPTFRELARVTKPGGAS